MFAVRSRQCSKITNIFLIEALNSNLPILNRIIQKIDYLRPYPSHSNFILNRVRGRDAGDLKASLQRKGILVRYYRTAGLQDCIRISVGTPEQNTRVLKALRKETI